MRRILLPERSNLFQSHWSNQWLTNFSYRVFVTDIAGGIDALTWFYNQRAGAEYLIKEANNNAGLAAYPSARWAMNCIHF